MTDSPDEQLTRRLGEERECSAEELLPLVYEQLKRIAQQRMAAERPEHTLQATALVHEAYMRVVGDSDPGWANRAQFFRAAADAMRRILIDHARKQKAVKRGGDRQRVPMSVADLARNEDANQVLMLDDALGTLAERDPQMAEVVRLRFFAGLGVEDTAAVLGLSESTVKREWVVARAWLHRELGWASPGTNTGKNPET